MFSISRGAVDHDLRRHGNASRRWTTVTVDPNFDRKIASSIAPVAAARFTAILRSRKKAASHVAQKEMPREESSSSPGHAELAVLRPPSRGTPRHASTYTSSPT